MKNSSKKLKEGANYALFDPDQIAKRLHQCYMRDIQQQIDSRPSNDVSGLFLDDSVKHYVINQDLCFLKKYRSQSQDQDVLKRNALAKFADVYARVQIINSTFSWPRLGLGVEESDILGRILIAARQTISDVLGDLELTDWFSRCNVSGGVTLGLKFERTNIEDKFTYPLTTTASVLPIYDCFCAWDPQHLTAVEELNRYSDSPRFSVVNGSRMTTVPKDDRAERLIAIEPTLNMFFQQGLMDLMYQKLKNFGLDLSTLPQLHQNLAYLGSITGKLATIDFSSASDSVAKTLVSFLFPPDWCNALLAVRSRTSIIDGEEYELPMYATMGNATTFPVETLIFYSIGLACVAYTESDLLSTRKHLNQVSVFGDDVILPTQAADLFILVSKCLGLEVNDDKSFISRTDRFRESCGGDFFAGRNVRPFYLRAPSGTSKSHLEAWMYTVCNGIIEKYITYFGDLSYVYYSVFDVIFDVLSGLGCTIKTVPDHYPDDAGLKIWGDFSRFQLRWPKANFSKVFIDKHGSCSFNYLQFRYKRNDNIDVCNRSHELRYWQKSRQMSFRSRYDILSTDLLGQRLTGEFVLRFMARMLKDFERQRNIASVYASRKIGGYVVGRVGFPTRLIKTLPERSFTALF